MSFNWRKQYSFFNVSQWAVDYTRRTAERTVLIIWPVYCFEGSRRLRCTESQWLSAELSDVIHKDNQRLISEEVRQKKQMLIPARDKVIHCSNIISTTHCNNWKLNLLVCSLALWQKTYAAPVCLFRDIRDIMLRAQPVGHKPNTANYYALLTTCVE